MATLMYYLFSAGIRMNGSPDLATVFELCQPRKLDRKVSLSRLQKLFDQHTSKQVYIVKYLMGKKTFLDILQSFCDCSVDLTSDAFL